MATPHHLDSLSPLASVERAGTSHAAKGILCALATASCCVALAQVAGPTDNKGVTTTVVGSIDLSGEVPEVAGRQLRARKIAIEPGGLTGIHTHVSRPTLEYVLQGNVVEVRPLTCSSHDGAESDCESTQSAIARRIRPAHRIADNDPQALDDCCLTGDLVRLTPSIWPEGPTPRPSDSRRTVPSASAADAR